MRKAKILVIASADSVNTSKYVFWPGMIVSAQADQDWMPSISMAI